MKQRTLAKNCSFEGKGLHTGRYAHMEVCPAPEDTGVRFIRTDICRNPHVDALAANVVSTARSTTIGRGKARVSTIEHLLAALTGMGIDNAIVKIDSPEVPILDGSASQYVAAFAEAGIVEQSAERRYIELADPVEFKDSKTGSYVRLTPSDTLSYTVTIDFKSKVLGVQTVSWTEGEDFASEVAPCRTFCFLHEIQLLASLGLVKGGDVENAIVIVEKPVSSATLVRLSKKFGQPLLSVTEKGYLSNLTLRFDDECGRHKMLDLIGDLRLAGGFLHAKIEAYKPGHSINTKTADLIK